MDIRFSFYLQHNNILFNGNVLAICYKADSDEVKKYGLTGTKILIFIKNKKIDNNSNKKDINYFTELKKIILQRKNKFKNTK